MKALLTRFSAIFALLLILPAAPALAQVASFSAEIDCGGGGVVYMPGDAVPYTIRFENQTLTNIQLSVRVFARAPGIGTVPLFQTPITLGPNQDLIFDRTVNLPLSAAAGSYTLAVVARSDTEVSFDTCSFNVSN